MLSLITERLTTYLGAQMLTKLMLMMIHLKNNNDGSLYSCSSFLIFPMATPPPSFFRKEN